MALLRYLISAYNFEHFELYYLTDATSCCFSSANFLIYFSLSAMALIALLSLFVKSAFRLLRIYSFLSILLFKFYISLFRRSLYPWICLFSFVSLLIIFYEFNFYSSFDFIYLWSLSTSLCKFWTWLFYFLIPSSKFLWFSWSFFKLLSLSFVTWLIFTYNWALCCSSYKSRLLFYLKMSSSSWTAALF